MDFDFIKYSLEDEEIKNFIEILSEVDDINGYSIDTKLDIGVHRIFDIEQENYCFNFDVINQSASLLVSSVEQMFTEKLKSLLKIGVRSTRYKDVFDLYYLIDNAMLDDKKLLHCFDILIYNDDTMRENNIYEVIKRLQNIFYSKIFYKNLVNPKVNWLDINVDEVIDRIQRYLMAYRGGNLC